MKSSSTASLLLTLLLSGAAGQALAQEVSSTPKVGAVNGTTTTQRPVSDFTPVTDAMLRSPKPSDWMMLRGNYQGWGYSPLNQINKTNVEGLQLAWARVMEPGINQATPIVINGVMYLGNSGDVIQAIDAASGDLLWQYRRALPTREALRNVWGQRKRSVFVYGEKVYFVSWDNHVVALDAKTGKELWEVDRGGDYYVTNTTGPTVLDGVLIAGSNCQEAPRGCYVTAHDAETGKELWRNTFIPKPGEPGDKTWGGAPFEKRWMTGAWGPITYDPDLNKIFYGSSGVGPSSEAQRGQIGMTLAGTNTRYSVDPKTGKIAWSHQVLPRDNWDQDCVFEMMPVTTAVNPDQATDGMMAIGRNAKSGPRKTLIGIPCKTGIVWSFDAETGKFLWAKSTTHQNLVDRIDQRGRVTINEEQAMIDVNKVYNQCPTHTGGRDWPFSAYSPQTNVLYFQSQNLCADTGTRTDREPKPQFQYNIRATAVLAPGKSNVGRIDAVSAETGKTLWTWETRVTNFSPILATAGGLLFNGGNDRYLRALDQEKGVVLWQTRLGSSVFGATSTFSVKGRQYIAVTAGGGYNPALGNVTPEADQPNGGNMVYVFALPEKAVAR